MAHPQLRFGERKDGNLSDDVYFCKLPSWFTTSFCHWIGRISYMGLQYAALSLGTALRPLKATTHLGPQKWVGGDRKSLAIVDKVCQKMEPSLTQTILRLDRDLQLVHSIIRSPVGAIAILIIMGCVETIQRPASIPIVCTRHLQSSMIFLFVGMVIMGETRH